MRAASPWSVAVVVAAVLVVPLLGVTYLPLIDLPNHQARHFLAANLADIPALQRYYSFGDVLLPNSAAELLRLALGWEGDVYLFGRLTAGLYLVNLVAALMVLHRVLWGAWSAWPLAGALTAWNVLLWFGFENFYLALPFAVHGLSLWIGLERRPLVLRGLALALMAVAIYFMHIVAYGLMAAMVGLYELGRHPRAGRAIAVAALALAPPLLHFALVVLALGAGHGAAWEFGSPAARMGVLFAPFTRLPFWEAGLAEQALALATAVAAIAGLAVVLWRKWARLHKRLIWPMAGLAVLTLIVPEQVMGLRVMQLRAPVVLAVLVFAGLHWGAAPARVRTGAALVVAALLVARIWLVSADLVERDRDAREFIAAAAVIGPGDRAMAISTARWQWLSGVRHWLSYLVIERRAFVANLFNGANGLVIDPEWEAASHPHMGMVSPGLLTEAWEEYRAGRLYTHPAVMRTFWRTWWRDFTHIVEFAPEPGPNPLPGFLEPVARGSFFTIYRVVSDEGRPVE